MNLSWGVASLITIGAGIKVSHAVGENNTYLAKIYVKAGIVGITCISIFFFLFLAFTNNFLISLIHLNNPAIEQAAKKYLLISSISIPFMFQNLFFSSVFIGYGNSKAPFLINTIALSLNIVLDYLLIFPIHLGIQGTALATIIALSTATLLFYVKLNQTVGLKPKNILFRYKLLIQIVKLGISPTIQRSTFTIIAILMARIISEWGTTAIAVQKVGVQIEAISYMTAGGFMSALSAISGQAYGAKDYKKQWEAFYSGIILAFIIGIITSIVMYVFSEPLFSIFLHDTKSITMGKEYLMILSASQLFVCFELIATGAFFGWGQTHIPAITGITLTVLRIPIAFAFISFWRNALASIWWSISISSIAKGIILVLLYIILFKSFIKNKLVMEHDFLNSAVGFLKGNSWLEGLFGVEKENVRVDKYGHLAQTPHPKIFGNKFKHPYITTDFSESQIEMITPPLPSIRQTIGFLETIHDIVSQELIDEYLWPQSIPPILPDENQIPIAHFDEEGKEAQHYREFLAKKYGSKGQLFSGIHFNFSYSEKLLKMLYLKTNMSTSFNDFKNEIYLKTCRQMLRLRWLYILLYGNSPVVDSSLELQCKKAPFIKSKNIIALSIRNSCYGYRNFGDLYPDYSSASKFRNSINKMIKKQQLVSPKELYSAVRPKFTKNPNSISYIEFRFIDNNPLSKIGITEDALHFLHLMALYGLLTEEPDSFDPAAQDMANAYQEYVALYGLSTSSLSFDKDGKHIDIWNEAKTHIQKMVKLFLKLKIDSKKYQTSLMHAKHLIDIPDQRGIYRTLDGIQKMNYITFHLDRANYYLTMSKQNKYNFIGLEDMELSTQLLLREAIKRGVLFEIIDRKENFIKLQRDGNTQYVKQATKTSLDNYASILAMENKLVTKNILCGHGLRVPDGEVYSTAEAAKNDFALFQGKPIVVKPNQTNFGIGITILKDNTNEEIYQKAINIAFEHDSTILIEEFIAGKEFRFFLIGDEVAGILHRVPANITGDGTKSIRELVRIKNQDPLRGKGYHTPLEYIQLGEAEAIFLQAQNKNFDYIPASGETIYLRENSNISTGGDSIDYTDLIPDSYKQIAIKAAKALNVVITGLDMIIPDYTQDATDNNYAVIELNFNPAIHIHCYPFKGKNRKLNERLMDILGYNR